MNNNNEEIEIDLKEIFYLLKERILIILAVTMVFALGAGVMSKFMVKPVYSSTSKLYVLSQSTSITSMADIQIGTSLTMDYMELIKSRPVVETVIENLNLDTTYETMVGKVSVGNPTDTRILTITVQHTDAELAKDIVDEFAKVAQESISKIMATTAPNIVEEGHISKNPVSPNTTKNVMIAAILGMLLAVAVIVVIYIMDDTVKTEDDVEKYLGLNTLALIPLVEDDSQTDKKKKKR